MPSYLGQNFLIDSKAKTYIRELVLKLKEKYNLISCIEIGPGKGAITKLIQPIFHDTFWAIEKDTSFQLILEELINPSHIIWNDVLQVNLDDLQIDLNSTLVYGSLPYYITSPIIGKVFLPRESRREARSTKHEAKVGIFIVQKEFAQKVEVNAKKKSYLRRLLNHDHIVTYHKTIPAKGFSPAPKVDSAIVSIIKSETQAVDYGKMLIVLDKISGFKRKTIGKIIKILQCYNATMLQGSTETLKQGSIEAIKKKRLEELSRDEMKIVVDYLYVEK